MPGVDPEISPYLSTWSFEVSFLIPFLVPTEHPIPRKHRTPELITKCGCAKIKIKKWTPEQIDQTVALAKANFQEGAEKLKRTVRAVYERKKKLRLEMEEKKEEERHEENRRRHGIHDHFS